MKFDRLGGPLDEIVLFSVHKFSVIMWRHDVISFESLETVAMQGYFISFMQIVYLNYWI